MPSTPRPRVVAGLRLVTLVGQGGEGEVWEARDAHGDRRALKLIRPDSLVTPAEVTRRGRWLLTIDHPALVTVHRTGALRGGGLDGWGFVDMDFVDGASLHGAAADPGALDRMDELADALDALHAGVWSDGLPLVHRDVKPANLIATPDDRLVLVDHSTLRALDNASITRIGTPVFVAPEVMSGRIGPAADVYSFAVTTLALLTGLRGQELADHAAEPADLDVGEALRAALAVDPARRPTSCAAVLDPQQPLVLASQLPDTEQWVGDTGLDWHAGPTPTREAPPAVPPPPAQPVAAQAAWQDAAPADDVLRLDASDVISSPPPHRSDPWGPRPGAVPPGAAPDGALPHGAVPAPRPRTLLPWVLALFAVAGSVAALPSLAGEQRLLALGVAAAAHLGAHLASRRSLIGAVLAPPVSWALLLAARASVHPGRLRDWARPTLTGAVGIVGLGLAPTVLGAAVTLSAEVPLSAAEPLAVLLRDELVTTAPLLAEVDGGLLIAVAGLVLTLLALSAVRGGGPWQRLLLLPVWAAGALVLLAGVVLLPLALLVGRAGSLLRVARGTISGVAVFWSPARPY